MIYSLHNKTNMKCLLWISLVVMLPLVLGSTPYFDQNLSPYPKLLDDSPPGTFYHKFKATDPGSLKIIYSLENKIQDWLQINPDTGNVTVKKKIDREAMLGIGQFFVYATNTNNGQGSQQVILQITDVNNKPPIMTNIPYTKNIVEDAVSVGSVVYTVTYDDKDDQINTQTEITITDGNEDGTFRIEIFNIVLNKELDYDNGKRQYVLNLTARNTQPPNPQTSGLLTINVADGDDQGLEFLQKTYRREVIKGSAVNTPVVQVEAKDLDSLNETITYTIFPDSDPGNRYAINTSTGQITVNGGLDIGTQILVILATSKKHGSVVALVNITVVSILNKEFSVSVLEEKANIIVADLTTTEPSFSTTGATFAIESGNTGSRFVIDSTNLKVNSAPLDRETKSTYKLVIKLTKNAVAVGLATFHITVEDINDNSPIFDPPSYNVTVKEDLTIGSNIVMVTAKDRDAGINGTVRYAITSPQDLFTIDNITGQVTLSKDLDREKSSSHMITVAAYDGDSTPKTGTANITINVEDINDNSPVILPYIVSVSVAENENIGYLVTTIAATDADEGQNAKISYSISSGADGHFDIDSTTGKLTTTSQLSNKLKPSYLIVVAATDDGRPSRSTSVYVRVSITAVLINSYNPVFKPNTYLGGVFKDTSDNTLVLTVSAVDGDTGSNGEVVYHLIDSSDFFFIDPNTGDLKTINSFSDLEGERYSLTALAKDKALPPKTSENDATITVLVLRASHSVVVTAGVSQNYLLSNIEEFRRVLNNLTDGQAFIKNVRAGSDVNTTSVLFNVVDIESKTEKDYGQIDRLMSSSESQQLIAGPYKMWKIQHGRPKTSARTSMPEGGVSALVGAVVCLALMIGVGGIIMIIILLKKKRERERIRKAARVKFNDKPQFIDPIGKTTSSGMVENAQEAQEVIVHMADESNDELDHNYINDGYNQDNSDDEQQETDETFYVEEESVHFGTFFPPPPNQPPPPVPDSEAEESDNNSENQSDTTGNHGDERYVEAVLPPHEDFADDSYEYPDVQYYSESPTQSVTDSTTNLVESHHLHEPAFGFADGLRPSINKDLTTEL